MIYLFYIFGFCPVENDVLLLFISLYSCLHSAIFIVGAKYLINVAYVISDQDANYISS
jgi:hypothetical protein